ncbi:ArnT family glycosyltransferase [Ancylobacter sp.]|uniref:ArnT family glycosyltransferase n=1 Tax=Ancylobacter sp. TaxID=1872567 RepID=UPI003D0E77C5
MSLARSAVPAAASAPPALRRWSSIPLVRLASLAVFAAVAAWIVLTFRDYGISNDEPVQHTYGQLLLAWYASGFTDDRAFHYINLYLYGGLFDLIAAGLEPYVPLPLYEWRHLLSAGFGFAGLVGTWRLARLLGGEKAGVVAVLLLAFTGMYGGAMFTHTKDVPFAAAMVWSLYFVTVLAVELPALPRWRSVLGLGVAVGCALGLRVGGVFAVLYLALTVGAAMLVFRDVRLPLRVLPRLVVAGLVALALMAVTWPWSVLPPTNLFKAMGAFSNFTFDLKTLFNGRLLPIDHLPPTYMPEYLLIKLPEVTLLGLLAALTMTVLAGVRLVRGHRVWAAVRIHSHRLLAHLPLALAIVVPIAFALLDHPPLYNGIRHFLFILPPVTVLAALGLQGAWRALRGRSRVAASGFALAALGLFLFNASVLWRLHPYEYVAYNQLVGGTTGAWGRFEGDYWSASLREAALALRHGMEREKAPAHPYKVSVCAEDVQAMTYLGPNFQAVEEWDDSDFVLTAHHVGCDEAPGLPYATVSRMGIALASVMDQRLRHTPVDAPLPDEDDDKGLDLDAPVVSQKDVGPQETGPQVAKAKP